MSGGFFRGTTADQDTRFSNKHAKLLKSQKFPPELENLVDMTKVKMDVMRPWIAHRVTELLGFEDEVLINFIYGLLEEKVVNGKEIQISLTGFMEKNTGKFMKELWTHLLSAQQNASGVPQQFLDAKEEETRKKQEDTDRITRELKKTKEKEGREYEQERVNMDREADNVKAAALEPHSRRPTKFSSKWSAEDKEADERNGTQELPRINPSPHSADHSLSPPRRARSRSFSKSLSNSRSPSRSRSLSASPKPTRRSLSSERRHRSLSRRSSTPRRVDSRMRSPPKRYGSSSRIRSPSPVRRRLKSPSRRRSRSPVLNRSRSPVRRTSRSTIRHRSRSPIWRRSRSPTRRRSRSPIRRSRTPIRRRSRTPIRRRMRSPIHRRSRSPAFRRSRSPIRRRSRSPIRRRSRSPIRRRSPSPFQRRPQRPYRPWSHSSESSPRNMSLSPMHSRSPPPVRGRSPSPVRQRYQRALSSPHHRSPSPVRRRTTFPGRQRSLTPGSRSSSPSGRVSLSPKHATPPSMLKRGSPKHQQRSPVQSSRDEHRFVHRSVPDRQAPRKETAEHPPVSVRSLERDSKGRRISHNGEQALSSSPYKSPRSASPPAIGRSLSQETSPIPPPRQRGSMNAKDRLDRVEVERRTFSRSKEDKYENKNPVNDKLDKTKQPSEKLASQHHSSGPQAMDSKSKSDDGRRIYPELSNDMTHCPEKGYKADEMIQEATKLPKLLQKVERHKRSGSLDSGSEESDHRRKHKRSKRKDVSSDDDSDDSHADSKKEAKRRRKEERRMKKEEKRKRREERRRKKDSRRSEKLKLKAGENVSPSSDLDKSQDSHEEGLSDPKKLEIELRERALESLRAKKGVGH
uniref:serine/arginine repetitive matrix protein 1 isoform X2 n=1 Tax=Erigeron canadensis TaxID=72917 RepID=UPI001CB8E53B|nr:serine/arginine repetitive matrix protein 1 isoform X2 [Erigeron canadensis]